MSMNVVITMVMDMMMNMNGDVEVKAMTRLWSLHTQVGQVRSYQHQFHHRPHDERKKVRLDSIELLEEWL